MKELDIINKPKQLRASDFDYYLPDELIAQTPAENRVDSRLLVYNKKNKSVSHKIFSDIIDYLVPGDLLVLNRSRVIPARLFGTKVSDASINKPAQVEFLLLKHIDGKEKEWQALVKPGRRAKIGSEFVFGERLRGTVVAMLDEGTRVVRFEYDGVWENILDELGQMPLPPYITQKLEDKERYQCVYSKESGSAAAPTAGLHFDEELLKKISDKGVEIQTLLLHVGLGTFRPMKADFVSDHHMHSEYCEVGEECAIAVNNAKKENRRVICVGTTTCRTLESLADIKGRVRAGSVESDIFITPGYEFKICDSLITNFHLPQSTLLMLVSALISREEALRVYDIAVDEKYRFFSFGDAMLIEN